MESQEEQRKRLYDQIFEVNPENFESLAIQIWHYQNKYNQVYNEYFNNLRKPKPKTLLDIPFLPIQFFKSHKIVCALTQEQLLFKSSATTSVIRSNHYVLDSNLYEKSFFTNYKNTIGNPEDHIILALLPSYISQGESSLVYMVDKLILASNNENSGFFLNDLKQLVSKIETIKTSGKKMVLFGVSYALLDLADLKPNLSNVVIIETGGMKGRRQEMSKSELHSTLKNAFNVSHIASEYGMTELLSQGYSLDKEVFSIPTWMKVMFRQVNDPFSHVDFGSTGGINVIDLANLDSCAFIETQDLGKEVENGFLLMGRFDFSDIRGCNLLVQ